MKSDFSISHPWLGDHAGSERVFLELLKIFPKSDLYCLWADQKKWKSLLEDENFYFSYLNNIPTIKKNYRKLIPMLGKHAVEQLPTVTSKVHISNCHGFIKGINVSEETYHYCYCYSPIRWISDQKSVYRDSLSGAAAMFFDYIHPRIKKWEFEKSKQVDQFIAISKFVSRRIKKYLKRDSKIIYPPVDTRFFKPAKAKKRDGYLLVSRFVPYKRINTAIDAFVRNKKNITIVGSGKIDYPNVQKYSNINFLANLSDEKLRHLYRSSKALIFTSVEDFGLVPVEAMACGTPVVALGQGGALETIKNDESGIFYENDDHHSLNDAIERFEDLKISPDACRDQALKFSSDRFAENIKSMIKVAG